MSQKRLACFQEIADKRYDDEVFASLTIYDVPASLIEEFSRKIIQLHYPGGVSEAIKDLMLKAILGQHLTSQKIDR